MNADLDINILVIDDMPAMRSILKSVLNEAGFNKVVAVPNAEMGWSIIQEGILDSSVAIDIVICDLGLEGMSGIDLLRAIRQCGPIRPMPFLVISARAEDHVIDQAKQSGATDYFVKPFSARSLALRVMEIARCDLWIGKNRPERHTA